MTSPVYIYRWSTTQLGRRTTRFLSMVCVQACAPSSSSLLDDSEPLDSSTPSIEDTAVLGRVVEEVPGKVVEETWPKSCADVYSQDILPTFELEVTEEVWSAFRSDCTAGTHNYRPVLFHYGDETVSAMARLKGNWSWSCDKYQFVISFNEEDSDGRFHGLRKIVLDAPWYDHSLLHERLAFSIFEERALPYSCSNNARLLINGDYYGLYANVERIDHEYLERHFEEYEGNLYQAGSELKTNEDLNDTSDIETYQSAQTVEEIEALVDLDQAVEEWSMEAMIPAMDNYWAGVEINYYIYNHPSRGFVYLPYDLDISFGDAAYTSGSLVWPDAVSADPIHYEHSGWRKEPLVETVLADPYWCSRFVEELEKSRAAFVPSELIAKIEAWDAQIFSALEADPNRPYSTSQHETAISHLKDFVQDRAAFVDDWLAQGGQCPSD